jgi:hypothetical protein
MTAPLSTVSGRYEGRKQLMDALKEAERLLQSGEEKLMWRYVATPQELIPEIMDLSCLENGVGTYPLLDTVPEVKTSFITQDEIDSVLLGGSGVSQGKMRIMAHFEEGGSLKDHADFLKKEYGKDVDLITYVGSVIGAHSGPGTLALFFRGKER